MKPLFPFSIILAFSLFLSACNPAKSTAEAQKAASEFHVLYDAEDFEKIYNTAHADFKASQPKADTIEFFESVREKLGKVKSTKRTSWNANSVNFKTNVVLSYHTEFEKGTGTETFTFRIADGKATLLGWHINSRDLVVSPAKNEVPETTEL